MINGQLGQWISEAQQHWHNAGSALSALGAGVIARPWLSELLKGVTLASITAIAASWFTVQLSLARLEERFEERYKAQVAARDRQIGSRDSQISEMKADMLRNEVRTTLIEANRAADSTRLVNLEIMLRDHISYERRAR